MTSWRTVVYVDGENVRHWNPAAHLDIAALGQKLANREAGFFYDRTVYATGLEEEDVDRQAIQIGRLNRLCKDPSVEILGIPFQRGTQAGKAERGVDLMLDVRMIRDLLEHDVDGFILLSDDRDHAPAFRILAHLAQEKGQPIRLVSAYHHSPAAPMASGVRITDQILRAYSLPSNVLENVDAASRQRQRTNAQVSIARPATARAPLDSPAPHGRSAYVIDANSIGGAAKDVLGRKELDVDLRKLIRDLERRADRQAYAGTVLMHVHEEYDLEAECAMDELCGQITKSGLKADRIPYAYRQVTGRVLRDTPLRNVTIPYRVPDGKQLGARALERAIYYGTSSGIDTVVIVSDDPDLAPIVEGTLAAARALNKRTVSVVHAHLNPHTKTFLGAYDLLISAEIYHANAPDYKIYDLTRPRVAQILGKDLEDLQHRLAGERPDLKMPSRAACFDLPGFIGEYLGHGQHWCAFKISNTEIAYIRQRGLQELPRIGMSYNVSFDDRGGRIEHVTKQDLILVWGTYDLDEIRKRFEHVIDIDQAHKHNRDYGFGH